MWRRTAVGLICAAAALAAAPAAQAQDQSLIVNFGYFALKGQDSRVAGDILNAERCIDTTFACEPLLFDVKDFNNGTFSADWVVGLGDYFEATGGIGFYQETTPSVYEFLTNSDGSEINQDLKFRMVPITVTARFVPTTRLASVQPYIGVGVSFVNWRYSETGEFVDTTDNSIFRATYEADGWKTLPVVLGGVKFPLGGDRFLLGGEVRWQTGDAELPAEAGFISDRIDLGGFTYSGLFQIRF
jgi:outer membrane protein W